LNEGGVSIGLPGDVEDFKDFIFSTALTFLVLFLSRKKEHAN